MNPGRRSNSTRSVTWNLELLCFLGVLAMGIVSLGPVVVLALPAGPAFGGVPCAGVSPSMGGDPLVTPAAAAAAAAERGLTGW